MATFYRYMCTVPENVHTTPQKERNFLGVGVLLVSFAGISWGCHAMLLCSLWGNRCVMPQKTAAKETRVL